MAILTLKYFVFYKKMVLFGSVKWNCKNIFFVTSLQKCGSGSISQSALQLFIVSLLRDWHEPGPGQGLLLCDHVPVCHRGKPKALSFRQMTYILFVGEKTACTDDIKMRQPIQSKFRGRRLGKNEAGFLKCYEESSPRRRRLTSWDFNSTWLYFIE